MLKNAKSENKILDSSFFSVCLILKPSFMLTVNLLRHYKTVRQRDMNTSALLENGRKPKKIWIMLSFSLHQRNGNLNLLHQIMNNSQHEGKCVSLSLFSQLEKNKHCHNTAEEEMLWPNVKGISNTSLPCKQNVIKQEAHQNTISLVFNPTLHNWWYSIAVFHNQWDLWHLWAT